MADGAELVEGQARRIEGVAYTAVDQTAAQAVKESARGGIRDLGSRGTG